MNIFLFLFCLVNIRIAVGSQSSVDKDVLHLETVANTYNVSFFFGSERGLTPKKEKKLKSYMNISRHASP
jgi:hypothetical protein